ncbi:MAG: response regulator [Bacteriovorax sp.]|nr:response regulator [Bacteriovorax sp.]
MALDKKIQRDVLIIDDDKNICEVLREYCHNMGCFKNIVFANDGIMATQKLRNQKFSLILLDMNMPKKSGYDILSEFGTDTLNQKENILVVSGTLEKDLIAKILARGVKTFLVKPFDEPTFQDRVLKILNTPSTIPSAKP